MSGGDFVLPKIGGAFVRGDFVQGGFCPGLGFPVTEVVTWPTYQPCRPEVV